MTSSFYVYLFHKNSMELILHAIFEIILCTDLSPEIDIDLFHVLKGHGSGICGKGGIL